MRQDDTLEMPPCRTCAAEASNNARRRGTEPVWTPPADYVAMAPSTDGSPALPWPVCEEHMQIAMVAGWFPVHKAGSDEARAAIAMLAQREQSS